MLSDLIVYYTGHGGFTGPDQAYFLAGRRTKSGSEGASSIRYVDLAASIRRHAAGLRKYLILDCCFAASAARFQSNLNDFVVSRVEDELPPAGTALLCSSAAKFVSIAPEGERYTMFSGALLQCLKEGIPDHREALSLEEVGLRTHQIIRTKFPNNAVRPELHVPDQTKGDPAKVPLFPNPGLLPEKRTQPPPQTDAHFPKPSSREFRADSKTRWISRNKAWLLVLPLVGLVAPLAIPSLYRQLSGPNIILKPISATIKKNSIGRNDVTINYYVQKKDALATTCNLEIVVGSEFVYSAHDDITLSGESTSTYTSTIRSLPADEQNFLVSLHCGTFTTPRQPVPVN
jgi:hypothetical protein